MELFVPVEKPANKKRKLRGIERSRQRGRELRAVLAARSRLDRLRGLQESPASRLLEHGFKNALAVRLWKLRFAAGPVRVPAEAEAAGLRAAFEDIEKDPLREKKRRRKHRKAA